MSAAAYVIDSATLAAFCFIHLIQVNVVTRCGHRVCANNIEEPSSRVAHIAEASCERTETRKSALAWKPWDRAAQQSAKKVHSKIDAPMAGSLWCALGPDFFVWANFLR